MASHHHAAVAPPLLQVLEGETREPQPLREASEARTVLALAALVVELVERQQPPAMCRNDSHRLDDVVHICFAHHIGHTDPGEARSQHLHFLQELGLDASGVCRGDAEQLERVRPGAGAPAASLDAEQIIQQRTDEVVVQEVRAGAAAAAAAGGDDAGRAHEEGGDGQAMALVLVSSQRVELRARGVGAEQHHLGDRSQPGVQRARQPPLRLDDARHAHVAAQVHDQAGAHGAHEVLRAALLALLAVAEVAVVLVRHEEHRAAPGLRGHRVAEEALLGHQHARAAHAAGELVHAEEHRVLVHPRVERQRRLLLLESLATAGRRRGGGGEAHGVHVHLRVGSGGGVVPAGQRPRAVQLLRHGVHLRPHARHVGRRREAADDQPPPVPRRARGGEAPAAAAAAASLLLLLMLFLLLLVALLREGRGAVVAVVVAAAELAQQLRQVGAVEAAVGRLAHGHHRRARLAPRQQVGVVLVRPHQHHRLLRPRRGRAPAASVLPSMESSIIRGWVSHAARAATRRSRSRVRSAHLRLRLQAQDARKVRNGARGARAGEEDDVGVGVGVGGARVQRLRHQLPRLEAEAGGLQARDAAGGVRVGVHREHHLRDVALQRPQRARARRPVGVHHAPLAEGRPEALLVPQHLLPQLRQQLAAAGGGGMRPLPSSSAAAAVIIFFKPREEGAVGRGRRGHRRKRHATGPSARSLACSLARFAGARFAGARSGGRGPC
eukprot:scaffold4262_cov328-Prasinococcus_capsulatus_cf.AAC.6